MNLDEQVIGVKYCRAKPSKESLLRTWIATTLKPDEGEQVQDLIIHRRHVLDSTLRGVCRISGFDWTRPFKVSFAGEIGDDLGGPKRELFRYLKHNYNDADIMYMQVVL